MSDKLQFVDYGISEGPNIKPFDKLKLIGHHSLDIGLTD